MNIDKAMEIRRLMEDFIEKRDRSIQWAGRLEVALDNAYSGDCEFQDLVLALATYRPGGGDYLYDESQMEHLCKWALNRLNNASDTR